MSDTPIQCPHCGNDLNFETVAEIKGKSRLTMSIEPMPGELLAGVVLGEKIAGLASIISKFGDVLKVPTAVFVERIQTHETGRIEVTFLSTTVVRGSGRPMEEGDL